MKFLSKLFKALFYIIVTVGGAIILFRLLLIIITAYEALHQAYKQINEEGFEFFVVIMSFSALACYTLSIYFENKTKKKDSDENAQSKKEAEDIIEAAQKIFKK